MIVEPDIEAKVTFIPTEDGGRDAPFYNGYKPNHLVKEDYLTSGSHTYIGKEEVTPGETVEAYIKFLAPEEYPGCLWEGKVINVQEGSRVVGFAKVIKIFNKVLEK